MAGQKPHTRGVVMNPIDHPMGGGEGKSSGGRHPCTPWGVPTKGYKRRERTNDRTNTSSRRGVKRWRVRLKKVLTWRKTSGESQTGGGFGRPQCHQNLVPPVDGRTGTDRVHLLPLITARNSSPSSSRKTWWGIKWANSLPRGLSTVTGIASPK